MVNAVIDELIRNKRTLDPLNTEASRLSDEYSVKKIQVPHHCDFSFFCMGYLDVSTYSEPIILLQDKGRRDLVNSLTRLQETKKLLETCFL